MVKDKAIKVLQAVACCAELNLCNMCPWNGTKDCEDTAFSKQLIIEAVKATRGE